MNRIDQLFQNRKAPVLSIYFCAPGMKDAPTLRLFISQFKQLK